VKALQSALIRPVWETDRGRKRGPWVLRTERNDRATTALLVPDLGLGLEDYFQSIRADEADAIGGSAADG
jgi:hypothetical protein